ncbi:putative NBD/HSP70 family sugar kinase/biotin operon repressor [Leifsonia sp. AK011]|uniref:ROK family transcriptional regulator n=1 Tax=Leifsonia sp. AK011 TaxID=2723075 RepID=UPI001804AADE|nr:ROK family transcriptional regulator [Leifsonia sp. AK011]NYF11695.1 putative NBD/HSP70 family sugar kinase/biotin operon repressor [Leifsonia sp. AK011]
MSYNELSSPVQIRGAKAFKGNNLDDVRRTNLSLVLGLVHTSGAVSRAQLTRELGLNRSTIAALVSELVARGLVVESSPEASSQVGRPSLVITPSPSIAAITINPELDAITIGLVGLGGKVIRRVRYDNVRVPSPQEVVNVVKAVVDGMTMSDSRDRNGLAEQAIGEQHVIGLGLAIPGLVRASDGMVRLAPHLGWRDEPFAQQLSEATGFPVVGANDAMCGAIAEHTFGAGRGVDDMIYLNGGASGIGGGVIVDGVLLTGANGYAGELGHTLVNTNGTACHCGSSGCLETEVSRRPLLDALGLDDNESERLDEALNAAYVAGPSPELRELVERQVRFLIVALRNAANVFNTRRVVLGGFLGSLYGVVPEQFAPIVDKSPMIGGGAGVEVQRASLGPSILMVGAAELAFAPLLADPTLIGSAERTPVERGALAT